MNKKIIVLAVACVLFLAATAHPADEEGFRFTRTPRKRDRTVVAPGYRHDEKDTERFIKKPEKLMGRGPRKEINRQRTVLSPRTLTEKTIVYGELFSIKVSDGDALAVQVVRSSDRYTYPNGRRPILNVCHPGERKCITDEKKNTTLSFYVSPERLRRMTRGTKGMYNFALTTFKSQYTGVIVDLYACVGVNASLATCRTPVKIRCAHGMPSRVLNVCVCNKGYTGKNCSILAPKAPDTPIDSEIEKKINHIISVICCVVFNVMTFVFFFVLVCTCCCLRACCARRRRANRGRVVNDRPAPVPPQPHIPPAYINAGYRPVPPPPPMVHPMPPPPPPTHRCNPYEGIELATMPPKPANPVIIMPPLAPVNQIPVYVLPTPPAPKN